MNYERDESKERRRSRLSPAGRELLAHLEHAAEALEPPSEETLRCAGFLPSSDRGDIAAIFGVVAQEMAER